MADSIQQARREVQIAFEAAVAWAENNSRRTFAVFEARAWTLVLAVGRAMVQLFLAHQAARARPLAYGHDGKAYRLDDQRVSELGTRFGKVPFERPVGRSVADRRAAADLPVDRALGLCAGFSLGVVAGLTRLVAQMAFQAARQTYREIYEWAPSPRAVLRMVDGVGARARPFLEQAAVPADDGEVLLIQVDGRGAPMISAVEHARRRRGHEARRETRRLWRRRRRAGCARGRRTKGQKSKNAKVAVVGVLYTLRSTPEGNEGPIQKRIYATFESHRALFDWLRREADKRGYGTKRTILLGDGSDHIWRLQQEYFPQAEACLDWYHAVEYVWAAGECLHPEGSPELRTWVAQQARALRRGSSASVLAEFRRVRGRIPRTGPGTKGKRTRLDNTIRYFVNNRQRLIYRELRRDDIDIGSGAVEGAVRNLVGMRLDGPGMRWSRQRSEMVLHLRCILLNGQWSEFVDHLRKQPQVLLPAQPVPTMPHTATKKAA